VSIDDWDALLCAVKDRLRQTVGESPTRPMNGSSIPVRDSVLECVDALDQLHATLRLVLAGQSPSASCDPQDPQDWGVARAGGDAAARGSRA